MIKKTNPLYKSLSILILFCILLLIIRIKITNSLFYGFLIWNLFLAIVPYLISERIKKMNIKKISKFKLILFISIWLLFLPNAPYIITDFVHLHHSKSVLVWLDIFLLFTFSTTGIIFTIISLLDIYKIINQKWNLKFANYFSIIATFLCGFGIYLGRFLRLNSWNVFTSPLIVLKKSFLSIYDSKTWFITFAFGGFLWILFLTFKTLISVKNSS